MSEPSLPQRDELREDERGEHFPTTPVQCVCGWRETDPDAGSWVDHMTAARRDDLAERVAAVISGVRAWCAINEIAEPPLDWAGLGEFLDRAALTSDPAATEGES